MAVTTYNTRIAPDKPELMQTMVRRMWAPMVLMGVMILVAAFIIGLVNQNIGADFFGQPKEVQDATAGGDLQTFQTIKAWLPGFKFLGIGFLLAGITMVVATIIGTLGDVGRDTQKHLGQTALALTKPLTGKVFPVLMMMGLMIIIAAFILGIVQASFVNDFYGVDKAARDAASGGFLALNGSAEALKAWVEPFKFVGVGTLLTGIALALFTIVKVLRFQGWRLKDLATDSPRDQAGAISVG